MARQCGVPPAVKQLRLLSPAKLNLFLNITGRRADGYHTLQTLFQLLDYGDELRFQATDTPDITLSPSLAGVADADNLILRAARLLREASACERGAYIELDKRLPLGGGIGGGSSNAATTLLALNHLWRTGLSLPQLAELGLPFLIFVFALGASSYTPAIAPALLYLLHACSRGCA